MVECSTLTGNIIQVPREKLSFRISIYGVVLDMDLVLLIQGRTSRKWWFPGGGLTPGESMDEALKRELIEETGIHAQIVDFLTFKEEYFYHDVWQEAFHSIRFYFLCNPSDTELIPDDKVDDGESQKPRWINIDTVSTTSFDQPYGYNILQMAITRNREHKNNP